MTLLKFLAVALAVAPLLSSASVQRFAATPDVGERLVFGIDTVFAGDHPNPVPATQLWARATFINVAPGQVDLLLEPGNLDPGSRPGETPVRLPEFVTDWVFNFNPNKAVADLAFDLNGNLTTLRLETVYHEADSQALDVSGLGGFDLRFNFPDVSDAEDNRRFTLTQNLRISIFSKPGVDLTIDDFYYKNGGADGAGYYSAMHVAGIGRYGSTINFVPNAPSIIPEPATGAGLTGLLILILGGWLKRRPA
jgi:hypothetical protein